MFREIAHDGEISPGAPPATMLLTYKCRLNLEKRQHRANERILEQERQLYIAALAERIDAWQKSAAIAVATILRERNQGLVTYIDAKPAEAAHVRRERAAGIITLIKKPKGRWKPSLGAAARDDEVLQCFPRSDLAADVLAKLEQQEDRVFPRPALGQPQVGAGAKALMVRRRADLPPGDRAAIEKYEDEVLAGIRRANWGLSEGHQSQSLTKIRAEDPAYAGVQRRISKETLARLEKAYQTLFAGGGFPRFPGYWHWCSYSFDAFLQVTFDGKALRFSGMPGALRVKLDRALPEITDPETGARTRSIKGLWIKAVGHHHKRGRLKWYCGLQVETEVRESRAGLGRGQVGVDWGTSVLAALSTGEMIPNPRHGEALAGDLRRAQRALARRKKGSKRRLKARIQLQRLQTRTANRRRNTMDKLSKRLVTHWRQVATEKIDAKGLMNAERPGETLPAELKRRRNRELLDAAPYQLRQMTSYKARLYGATHIEVEPGRFRNDDGKLVVVAPTQECFWCGRPHYKELSDAVHTCTTPGMYFGLSADRKVNAARVIDKRASALVVEDRAGTVPEGAASAANGGIGRRRPGNTEAGQPAPGRRGQRATPIPTRMHDAKHRLRRPP